MNKKVNVVSVKFSNEELEKIDINAMKTCRKRSTFIREVALGFVPKEKPPEEFYEVLNQLRYMNNNLNQLTSKAHSLGILDERKYEKQVSQISKLVLDLKRKYLVG